MEEYRAPLTGPSQPDEWPAETTLIETEKQHINSGRQVRLGHTSAAPWCGIGLSGGGIRSASLALGVLQAFAENNLLRRFDYLSTVSGGGYIGASLQWWWARLNRQDPPAPKPPVFGLGPNNFPYGPARPAKAVAGAPPEPPPLPQARKNLAFLRAHASYLMPGNGLNAWSLLGVLLRTIVISLLIWVPLLIGCFIGISVIDWLAEKTATTLHMASPILDLIPSKWKDCVQDVPCHHYYPTIYAMALYCFYGAAVLFVSAAILFALLSRAPQDNTGGRRSIIGLGLAAAATAGALVYIYRSQGRFDLTLILVMSAGIIFIGVAALLILAEVMTPASLNASYWLRRTLERMIGRTFIPSLVALAIATIPISHYYLETSAFAAKYGAVGGGIVGLLGGIFSALYGYYTFLRNIVPGLVGQIMATIGAILYLYATLLVAYVLSVVLLNAKAYAPDYAVGRIMLALGGSILLALALGLIANINYVGLHRYYRDRLMEAFMPSDTSVSERRSHYSEVADNLSIVALRDSVRSDPNNAKLTPAPYPLINTNVILVNDNKPEVAARGGDNFLISPLFIGSRSTGWQDTAEYIERNGPLSLASAMAASGAAASARAGYIGTGITMNPLVSAVMSLLNIRLGVWIGNPFHRKPRRIRSIPTFLNPGLVSGVLGISHKHDSGFVELTDGGHFENLALYELVRRKLELILIVDGEADPTISLRSLVSATRRIEQDFGASLEFFKDLGPELLVMYESKGYPAKVRYAESPFLVGQLTYRGGRKGMLIYVKSTVIKGIDFTTAGYLASNPDFPHQTTVDQFFDPDQFDAYRYLGYESGSQVIKSLGLAAPIWNAAAIIAQYAAKATRPQATAASPTSCAPALASPDVALAKAKS